MNGRYYCLALSVLLEYLKNINEILKLSCGKGIHQSGFMDDFINQAGCRCKTILMTNAITLAFICNRCSVNWGKSVLDPTQPLLHLGFQNNTVHRMIT